MPLVFNATPSGAASNSYVSVEDAQAYFDGRLNVGPWTAANQLTKETALVAATARLEQESFRGWRFDDAQRLKWPRDGVIDEDGVAFAPAVIPDRVKFATCELALHMLTAGTTDTQAPTGLEAFKALSVGSIELTLRDFPETPGGLPATVVRWLRGLLASSGGIRLVRG